MPPVKSKEQQVLTRYTLRRDEHYGGRGHVAARNSAHACLQYSSRAYWNKRYAFGEECFDWYQRYQTLQHVIVPFVPRGEPVLQVSRSKSTEPALGCASS